MSKTEGAIDNDSGLVRTWNDAMVYCWSFFWALMYYVIAHFHKMIIVLIKAILLEFNKAENFRLMKLKFLITKVQSLRLPC